MSPAHRAFDTLDVFQAAGWTNNPAAHVSQMRMISFALVLSILPHVQAHGEVAPSADPCPGATSWSRSSSNLSEATPRVEGGAESTITDAALFKELQARVDRDQAARRSMVGDSRR